MDVVKAPDPASDQASDSALAAPAGGGAPAQPIPAIELVGIAKRFHSRRGVVTAVERVDLTIGEGEFFSLLGPSGCGKTTTLRMIGGFEEPTEGQILLYGRDVVGVPPNHRDVNMVFQSYALFPHMSVYENVAFGLRRKGVDGAEVNRRVNEMLDLVRPIYQKTAAYGHFGRTEPEFHWERTDRAEALAAEAKGIRAA